MKNNFWGEDGASYQKHRPSYPADLAAELARHAPNRTLALDVGCGTGQFSTILAAEFDAVIATDMSTSQLDNAPARQNITYKKCPAEALEVPHKSCALITAAQAAHWFDLPAFYKEARRIAMADAIIALITYGVFEADERVNERLQKFYWEDIHAFWPDGRQHVENGYRDFAFPFDPVETTPIAIERNWTVSQMMDYIDTWSAVKLAKQENAAACVAVLKEDLLQIIGPTDTFFIKWPVTVRAGRI